MNEKRQEIYLAILHRGLINLRDAAYQGNVKLCEIEADHLHNIPDLILEEDKVQHEYYFEKERTLYIERARSIPVQEGSILSFTLTQYEELWAELEIELRKV